eukprot:1297494-Prymnesium_polylepis.1
MALRWVCTRRRCSASLATVARVSLPAGKQNRYGGVPRRAEEREMFPGARRHTKASRRWCKCGGHRQQWREYQRAVASPATTDGCALRKRRRELTALHPGAPPG